MNAVVTEIAPKTLQRGARVREFQPIRLKSILAEFGISSATCCRAIAQRNGKPLSRTALSFLLNYGEWPSHTPAEAIRSQIEALLAQYGVPPEMVEAAWGADPEALAAQNKRASHGRHPPPRAHEAAPDQPDIPEKEMLSPQARKHFQIFRDPFTDEIRGPEDIYLAADQRYIREAMYQTARNGGFIAVVGESGAGKTTLRHDLIDRVTKEGGQILFIQPRVIDKTRLTARIVCEAILGDLAPSEVAPVSLERLARKVEKILTESYHLGNRHVLLIEEAQDLEPRALKHLKRFYELQAGYAKLLSIILIGQPELKNLLDERQHFELREVIRRCEIAELMPLDTNVREYVGHKFQRMNKPPEEVFAADAWDAIVARLTRDSARGRVSMVYPLVVNNLVTRAMNLAASIGERLVSAEVVKEV
ncbi:MAG: AAA family ATPase [Burkholderiales bacterium]|nr:AAA family ATPase [Burkholderiales bacterium]